MLGLGRQDSLIAERARSSGRIGMLGGIENVGSTGRGWRGARNDGIRLRRRGRGRLCPNLLVLHAFELHLELLIAILQLLDCARELAKCVFHAIEANGEFSRISLGNPAGLHCLRGRLPLPARLAPAE